MKARMLREEEITHPDLKSARHVAAWMKKLHDQKITKQQWRAGMYLTVKEGHIVDHPQAHMLVRMGMAEPFDEECRLACQDVDIDLVAEAQDRTREARLTGDPDHDRPAEGEITEEPADVAEVPDPTPAPPAA